MSETQKTTALVAEGGAALAKVMAFVLRREGLSIEIAMNGQEALKKAKVMQFDLVIANERLPVVTGRELCRRLRGDQRYAETPIILLTQELGAALPECEFGVSAVISKPFGLRTLLDAVETALAATSRLQSRS